MGIAVVFSLALFSKTNLPPLKKYGGMGGQREKKRTTEHNLLKGALGYFKHAHHATKYSAPKHHRVKNKNRLRKPLKNVQQNISAAQDHVVN